MKLLDGLDLSSQQIHNVADGSSAADAATYGQLQALLNGLDWHPAVVAASTANLNLASPGATIDGVTMSTGERFLAKNQTTATQNGIYVFATSSTPATRATDFATSDQVQGAAVLALGGTTNADTAWVVNAPAVVGTDSISFVQFNSGGGATYSAGNGLTLTSTTFSVVENTGILVSGSGVAVDPSVVVLKYSASIGDGSTTDIVVNHNLGTRDVSVTLRLAGSPYSAVITDWDATDTNNVTVHFAVAPTSSQYRVTIFG